MSATAVSGGLSCVVFERFLGAMIEFLHINKYLWDVVSWVILKFAGIFAQLISVVVLFWRMLFLQLQLGPERARTMRCLTTAKPLNEFRGGKTESDAARG